MRVDAIKLIRPTPGSEVRQRPGFGAFTLIELMISIALVVILILGINAVFQYTTQAVGTGQAMSTVTRDSRAAQAVLSQDFGSFVANGSGPNDSACTIITCTSIPAFRNRADEQGWNVAAPTGDPKPLQDPDFPNGLISPVTYNFRNHRTDTLSFFARGLFPRQTGNDGVYAAPMSSSEAWIWYGHLLLPDNNSASPSFPLPGTGGSSSVNPNDYYASQFMLGRNAILLRAKAAPPNNAAVTADIYDNQSNLQNYIGVVSASNPNWSLLAKGSQATVSPAAATYPGNSKNYIENSRFDIALGSIQTYQTNLLAYIAGGNSPVWGQGMAYNFQANPFLTKSLTSQKMAQASPIFLTGCSQFIVEFAGDFVTQNNDPNDYTTGVPAGTFNTPVATDGTYGDVQTDTSDNVLDFIVDKTGDTTASKTNPAVWRRQIRWYGLPRDTSGDGIAQGFKSGLGNNDLLDVVPVRDVVQTNIYSTVFAGFSWENFTNLATPGSGHYNDLSTSSSYVPPVYALYFGPKDPRIKMIRITITLDDPNGRLSDGQTYQYVYTLP